MGKVRVVKVSGKEDSSSQLAADSDKDLIKWRSGKFWEFMIYVTKRSKKRMASCDMEEALT